MAKINMERRAKIGRERRARTHAQIVEAGTMLLAQGPTKALTVEAVAEAAGLAKGTFYYHFQNIEELVSTVSGQLGRSFDDVLSPDRFEMSDPIARLSFVFTQSLEKAISDTGWARLVVQSAQTRGEFARSVRDNLKTEIAEAIAQGHMTVRDPELAVDILVGIWLQVTRGILERVAPPELSSQALEAALRAIGSARPKNQSS